MKTSEYIFNLPLSFNQVVAIVKQLSQREKSKLIEVINKELSNKPYEDKTYTHLASEKVLSEDWLLKEEDEEWKDL